MSTRSTGHVEEIAASARAILDRETPADGLLQRLRSEDVSRGAWRAAAQVGWFRLLTSDGQGGLGAGPAELAALFKEIGRVLPAGPWLETVVVAGLLRDHADVGPDTSVITYAGSPAAIVEFGAVADTVIFRLADGFAAVDRDDITATPLKTFDLAGRPARLALDQAKARTLLAGPDAGVVAQRIDRLSRVARAAELGGLAAAALEMGVRYAKERVQFDRPIGSFQAVQHRLAEMAVATTAAANAVDAIVSLVAAGGPGEHAAALHQYAAGLARSVVLSTLQVHGGIGFTAEHPLHAYLKRVLRLQAIAGEGEPLLTLGKALLAG